MRVTYNRSCCITYYMLHIIGFCWSGFLPCFFNAVKSVISISNYFNNWTAIYQFNYSQNKMTYYQFLISKSIIVKYFTYFSNSTGKHAS